MKNLLKKVYKRHCNLYKADVKLAIETIFAKMADFLVEGYEIKLRKIGNLRVSKGGASYIHPITKRKATRKKRVYIKSSLVMDALLNPGRGKDPYFRDREVVKKLRQQVLAKKKEQQK